MGPGIVVDSGSSAPSSVPHSLATSRDDEDEDDEESSGRRSNGQSGGSLASLDYDDGNDEEEEDEEDDEDGAGFAGRLYPTTASTTSQSLDSAGVTGALVDEEAKIAAAAASRPRSTRGSQKWSNVRAVMALYSSLRKIKRTKSNQRWMKLRTTVQLSSAISTIQKKPPLKREDSFLKRFSTRQIPESQETIDTGEGDQSDEKSSSRRHRRPRRPQKPPKTVVNPDENFYYYWLMLLSGCVLYNLWTLIVRQSMPELQEAAPVVWLSCDGFTDLVFALDVGVQFRTGYLEQGLMVYNSKKLAGHYFRSKSFALDLFALLPLDLLQVNLGSNPILRFPRFLKVYRVYNYYYMVESRTVYPNLWRVINLIHILLILAHWFGCFYYLLSEAEGFHGDWVYPYRPGEYATLTRKYLGSLYWSTLTLTTIGDLPTPETNAEAVAGGNPRSLARRGRLSRLLQFKHDGGYIFTIVSYLIGVFIFATIVGQVGNVITNRNANRLEFERLLDGAKTYMRHHKVPGGMKRRVLRWYDYSWSRGRIQGGGDINTALGLLPDKLKTELALHVNLAVLKKVTIFQECQPEFLHDLVLKMKAYIFTPGDSICRKGEVAREMFIIADGILEVISETGRVLTTMKAGDFFGEIGILNLDGLNKRTADVRSVGYSELFSLSREDVLAALKDYPEAQEILKKLGEKRLREAQRVARSIRHPPSPGHDSSDNSTGKRIVDKLKSDVKGLKNVLRKSRRNTRPEDGLELQPLTLKVLRRQTRVDESQDVCASGSEPPVSPLGAGLPLLSRLRLLKEKQEREEKRILVEVVGQPPEQVQTAVEVQNPSTGASGASSTTVTVPLLQRLWHMKSKAEVENVEREAIVKEPLLPRNVIPEESEIFASTDQPGETKQTTTATTTTTTTTITTTTMTSATSTTASATTPTTTAGLGNACSPTGSSGELDNGSIRSRPWTMLKDASLKTSGGGGGGGGTSSKDSSIAAGVAGHHQPSALRNSHPPATRPIRKQQPLPSARHSLVHIRQQTKKYASVDDLSPEYCGLPFVKKLKILNERQKLAELEKVVRSSSLDCGEGAEGAEFDGSLTRSHSEACAIEYARKLAKLTKVRLASSPPVPADEQQLSPENETLERRTLKSILKKLSASCGGGSGATRATTTAPSGSSSNASTSSETGPKRRSCTPELRKLMRAPTLEGYAARHSKLSKSVTFNKYTLQSPPGHAGTTPAAPDDEDDDDDDERQLLTAATITSLPSCSSDLATSSSPLSSASSKQPLAQRVPSAEHQLQLVPGNEEPQQQLLAQPLPSSLVATSTSHHHHHHLHYHKHQSFRPSGSGTVATSHQALARREDEGIGELVSGIRDVLQSRLESMQSRFEQQFSSLQLEIRKRDEIISQLQTRILELESPELGCRGETESVGDSTEHDASLEEDLVLDDNEDHPFMRDSSVDTVLTTRPRRRYSSPSSTVTDSSYALAGPAHNNRRSWEEHSEEETLELQDLPHSITPQSLWKDDVAIDLESSEDEEPGRAVAGSSSGSRVRSRASDDDDDDDEEDEQMVVLNATGHNNWEVAMLAQELEKRRRSSECSSPGS
ncbi:uncharacterized protein LOC106639567 [Copidosoma floridanum]|uniref:uncharacterized protein LOC106639567 n=1 Tax=Copidosoma floridanum TaxID=29053 RepID=UPI000C6FBE6D|nr:uncharacterized protein LOC106639567 [Copidosoma floridanum]